MLNKLEISPSVAIIVAGIIIALAILYTNLHPAAPAAAEVNAPTQQVKVSAPNAQDHRLGSPQAKIVLIEYSDFQCPFCALVYPTVKKLVNESNGQIALVMRHFPLTSIHPNANPAANASLCIAEQLGNEGFWKFSDAIFADQNSMSEAYYRELAVQFGADGGQYDSCYKASKYQAKIDAQVNEAQQNGGQGTPYTVIYGYGEQVPVSGAVPEANFTAVINAIKARH